MIHCTASSMSGKYDIVPSLLTYAMRGLKRNANSRAAAPETARTVSFNCEKSFFSPEEIFFISDFILTFSCFFIFYTTKYIIYYHIIVNRKRTLGKFIHKWFLVKLHGVLNHNVLRLKQNRIINNSKHIISI